LLISALNVGDWPVPRFLPYTPDERDRGASGIEGWISCTYGLDVLAKRNLPPAWNEARSRLLS
jgi:hypothetical protein